jgi:hypothetical protein
MNISDEIRRIKNELKFIKLQLSNTRQNESGNSELYLLIDGSRAMTGVLDLDGSARVYRDVQVQISQMKRGVGNPPGENIEDGFPTLDFDDTNEEEVFILVHSPHDHATGTDINLHVGFFVDAVDGAVERNVVWGIEYKVIEHGDDFDFGAGTAIAYMEHAIPITTGVKDLLACDNLIVPAAVLINEGILLVRLFRDADSTGGTDDHVGDARLVYTHFHYLTDKLGEAS